jgi:transcriptional regulator with XRE-family HTH domain
MSDTLGEKIRRVLREAPFAMRQLAADSGLSYDVLRSWRSGRRRPSRQSAQRLAAGLERRGQQLLELARELRDESGGPPGGAGAGLAAGGMQGDARPAEGTTE